LSRAASHGVHVLDLREHDKDLAEVIREMTGGRGPDAVVDAVGMEAHGERAVGLAQKAVGLLPDALAQRAMTTVGVDRLTALHTAYDAVRRGGTVSLSGVYVGTADPTPMMTLFDKQLTVRMGQCNVQRWRDDLLPLVEDPADPLGTMDLTTHEVGLDAAPDMYRIFRDKEDGCIKVVLHP
jgi:threonine dehydrogenase-like Zn-dependent dehydrogenase